MEVYVGATNGEIQLYLQVLEGGKMDKTYDGHLQTSWGLNYDLFAYAHVRCTTIMILRGRVVFAEIAGIGRRGLLPLTELGGRTSNCWNLMRK